MVCAIREHDWDGEYADGWLTLDCNKCKLRNVTYRLSTRELECIENGWWTVNDLYIRVNSKGQVLNPDGSKKPTKSQWKLAKPNPFEQEGKYSFTVERYSPPTKKPKKAVFFLPPIPWKWTAYKGSAIVSFGYAHTQQDAEQAATQVINR